MKFLFAFIALAMCALSCVQFTEASELASRNIQAKNIQPGTPVESLNVQNKKRQKAGAQLPTIRNKNNLQGEPQVSSKIHTKNRQQGASVLLSRDQAIRQKHQKGSSRLSSRDQAKKRQKAAAHRAKIHLLRDPNPNSKVQSKDPVVSSRPQNKKHLKGAPKAQTKMLPPLVPH